MEQTSTQPEWLSEVVGMQHYGIEIQDAYTATGATRPYGEDIPVVVLELSSKRSSRGYWYYDSLHEQWYWSGGSVKSVSRKALDGVIRDNFDFSEFEYSVSE